MTDSKWPLMEGKSNNKGPDVMKPEPEILSKCNKSVPKGLVYRELGLIHKQGRVATEFQRAAEDRLVLKNHEELPCELPDVSRSTFLMVFSPDGTKVASTHGNHNVYVTDLNTGKNVNTLSGHPRTPWCIAFHPSSNQILASGCLGGQVRVWDLHGGSEIWTAESQTVIASLAFHPTDRMLVIATYNELHFWDWSQPIPFTKCYTSNEKEKVRYVAFDPLGHKLITGISNAPHNQTQWDRVAAPTRPGSNVPSTSHSPHQRSTMMPPEQERRITVCYRSLVEQYEQLVQRYYDLSRSRTTPTMDRGTDPMDLSESQTPGTTGTQTQSHTRGVNRFLLQDNSGSSSIASGGVGGGSGGVGGGAGNSSSNSSGSSSSSSSGDNNNTTNSSSNNNNNNNSRNNPKPGTSGRTLRNMLSNLLMQRAQQRAAAFNTTDSSTTPTRRFSISSDRPSQADSTMRDASVGPAPQVVAADSPDLDCLLSRLREHSPSTPERPRRFFVSQRSAFQPRIPRSDQQSHTEPRLRASRHGYILQRRLAEEDSTSDVGVRYGIQLLSRHIDNMQRLCRARLEILQLQQIRRMWEDLQRQIRSLHVAVRESTFALTDSPAVARGRRRFRLYSHPREEGSPSEQGSHIPSVSQMMELARISDRGPSPGNNQRPEQSPSTQDVAHKETLARLHAQVAVLSRLKYVVGKSNGEPSRRSGAEPSVSQSAKVPNSDSVGGPSTQPDTAEGESEESGDKGTPCKRKRAEDTEASSSSSTSSWSPPSSSHQQRLWRISRRVHLRRPRLLALGSRPKLGCGNSSPRSMFRQHIRPWASTQLPGSEESGSTGVGTSNGSCGQVNSDPTVSSSDVAASTQSSSPSEEASQQSGNNTSSHGESQPGPSRCNRGEDTVPHGTKRKAEAGTSTVCPNSNSSSTRHEPTTSESIRAMIARLEALVRQQREQQEAARREVSHDRTERRTNMWGLRSDANSGSDSDSNPESERQQAWGRTTMDERLVTPADSEASSGSRHGREDWEWTRESTRLRARQVLSLMVESLTQFFEENGLSNNTSHAVLDEQIYNLYVLLQLALELTDLLLAQLVSTRRELEHQWVHRLRSPVALDASTTAGQRRGRERDPLEEDESRDAHRLSHAYATYRRLLRYRNHHLNDPIDYITRGDSVRRLGPRMMNCYSRHGHGTHRREEPHIVRVQNTPPPPPPQPPPQAQPQTHPHPPAQDAFTVPVVRVNDVLIPDTSILNQPQPLQRPQSPPPHPRNPFIPQQQQPQPHMRYLGTSSPDTWRAGWRPRFLHPRYMSPSPFGDDQEEPLIAPENINFIRDSFVITDAPLSPNHRIQAWDFSRLSIPDISNAEKNVIVAECKIHNDASVDVSSDGRLLVTLLPTGRLSSTAMLGVYSLEWESLGQCLYTTSFEQNAVSVSLSPASRHLLVGLASRRVALLPTDRHTMAQIFRLEGGVPGRAIGARGRLCHIRDIEQDREQGYMSLNCIRWAPGPGQGLVFGTNTGKLKVLR